jgi:hypothetical protein
VLSYNIVGRYQEVVWSQLMAPLSDFHPSISHLLKAEDLYRTKDKPFQGTVDLTAI